MSDHAHRLSPKTRHRVEADIEFAKANHLEAMPMFDAATAQELMEALDDCEHANENA